MILEASNYLKQLLEMCNREQARCGTLWTAPMVQESFLTKRQNRLIWAIEDEGIILAATWLYKNPKKTYGYSFITISNVRGVVERLWRTVPFGYFFTTSPDNIKINSAIKKAGSSVVGSKLVNTSTGKREFILNFIEGGEK